MFLFIHTIKVCYSCFQRCLGERGPLRLAQHTWQYLSEVPEATYKARFKALQGQPVGLLCQLLLSPPHLNHTWQCPGCSEVLRQGRRVSSKPWRVWDQVKISLCLNDFLSICSPPPNPCDLPEQRRPEYKQRRTSSYDSGQTRFHVKNGLSGSWSYNQYVKKISRMAEVRKSFS